MGGFASVVRGALSGLNEAAGNPQTAANLEAANQRARDAHIEQVRAQIGPHTLAIKGLQTKLQSLDPNDPHYHDEQALLTNEIARNLHEVRGILYPDKDPTGKGNFFERGITDKLHMTSIKRRQDSEKAKQAKGEAQDQEGAQGIAAGAVPFAQTPKAQELAYQRETQLQAAKARGENKASTEKATWLTGADGQQHPFELKDGKYVPIEAPEGAKPPEKGETEYQKAELDYKNKQLALQEAKQKAASDPNSPTARAALLRAQGEVEKSSAYMIRARAGAFGTDLKGNPLPGAIETPGGTPVGSMFASNFYKSAQGIAQLNDAQGAINSVGGAVKNLYSSGSSLANPKIATALANPEWTASKLAQGIVGKELSPQEREAVVAIRSAQENIQGMRKAAGGGLSNEQVNRLEAQLPGPNTPNAEYAASQLQYLNQTLTRLSQGVPETVGGPKFQGERQFEGLKTKQLKNNKGAPSDEDIINALQPK